ncbi:MAG: CHAD domain-containing protein [Phycisphaera sp.]|nr:CHAD domain-containing protein [Phycisphaera sp.]
MAERGLEIEAGLAVELASRRLALRQLARVEQAADHATDHDEPEALHALRVSIRRLRAVLRIYRSHLDRSVPRKLEKKLRAVMSDTGGDRDRQVQVHYLHSLLENRKHPAQRKRGIRLLLDDIESDRVEGGASPQGGVVEALEPIIKKLRKRLRALDNTPPLLADAQPTTMARATARLLRKQADRLSSKLDGIDSVDSVKACHAARIQVKLLRYLVESSVLSWTTEPTDDRTPTSHNKSLARAASALIGRLKQWQDMLGELNDRCVLEERIRTSAQQAAEHWVNGQLDRAMAIGGAQTLKDQSPARLDACKALASLMAFVHRDRLACYNRFVTRGLHRREALLGQIHRLADRLDPLSTTPTPERKDPVESQPDQPANSPTA